MMWNSFPILSCMVMLSGYMHHSKQGSPRTKFWNSIPFHSPKRELAKAYHLHPDTPMSHLPRTLAAKLNGVPRTHTRMLLRLMFSRIRLMGVQRERNFAKTSSVRKLLRIPATKMKPRHTATAVWPVRLSPSGLWGSVELVLQGELSLVLKLQLWELRTIAFRTNREVHQDSQLLRGRAQLS